MVILIRRKRKRNTIEAKRRSPVGQVVNEARAEPGERGRSREESDRGPAANTEGWGAERSPRRLVRKVRKFCSYLMYPVGMEPLGSNPHARHN